MTNRPTPLHRFVASFIDGLLCTLLAIAVIELVNQPNYIQVLLVSVLVAAYEIGATTYTGRTIGKLAFSLKVVQEDGVSYPTLTQSAKRFVAKWAEPLSTALTMVGGLADLPTTAYTIAVFVSVVRSADRRGWHDKFSGTQVLYSLSIQADGHSERLEESNP